MCATSGCEPRCNTVRVCEGGSRNLKNHTVHEFVGLLDTFLQNTSFSHTHLQGTRFKDLGKQRTSNFFALTSFFLAAEVTSFFFFISSHCFAVSPSGTYPADTAVDDARAAATRAAGTATAHEEIRNGADSKLWSIVTSHVANTYTRACGA